MKNIFKLSLLQVFVLTSFCSVTLLTALVNDWISFEPQTQTQTHIENISQ